MTLSPVYPLRDVIRAACAALSAVTFGWQGKDGMQKTRAITGGDIEVAQFAFGLLADLLSGEAGRPQCLRVYSRHLAGIIQRSIEGETSSVLSSMFYLRCCLGPHGRELPVGGARVTLACHAPSTGRTRFDIAVHDPDEGEVDTRPSTDSFEWGPIARRFNSFDMPSVRRAEIATARDDSGDRLQRGARLDGPAPELLLELFLRLVKASHAEERDDPAARRLVPELEATIKMLVAMKGRR